MTLSSYHPDPLLAQSGLDIFQSVSAAKFPEHILRYRNLEASESVGLDHLSNSDWLTHFGKFSPLPDNQPEPLALRYHGHQFRHYNPNLGDGRGFLFAQLRDQRGRLLDLGTKGSGQTPYSRQGDGRLTLKGGVREVLATTLLEALGVNTSKSFSLIETGEQLKRYDEPSPTRSAVLVRLSHSHIRFGSIERLAYLEDRDQIKSLLQFVIDTYYPEVDDSLGLFDAVVTNSAKLVAQWMMAGFVHGVLNTDNMNVTGESFDYGPYRFLPYYEPGFVAAYFDEGGLYAYARQTDAVLWNLTQLGRCFSLVMDSEPLVESLNAFAERYRLALSSAFVRRLNLNSNGSEADNHLLMAAFEGLKTLKSNGSFEGFFFDWFGGIDSKNRALKGPRGDAYIDEAFDGFKTLVADFSCFDTKRLKHTVFSKPEPETLLIDEIEAIWDHIDRADDWGPFETKLSQIKTYGQALNLKTE
jgi:serine/tyrosine/threonine adenylyltransferase